MKRKTITYAISFLMAIALISVGFASWIISAPTSVEVEGSITTENVVDARIGLTTKWGKFEEANSEATHKYDATAKKYVYASEGATHKFVADADDAAKKSNNVYFGNPTASFEETDWLTNDVKEDKENLVVYLQVELSNVIQRNDQDEVTSKLNSTGITFEIEEKVETGQAAKYAPVAANSFVKVIETDGVYSAEKTTNLVKGLNDLTMPTIHLVSNTVGEETKYYLSLDATYDTLDIEVNEDPEVNEGKTAIVVAIQFEWGTAFDGKNPYEYYNQFKPEKYIDLNENSKQDEDESIADIAITNITSLHGLNDAKFKLTIKGQCSQ